MKRRVWAILLTALAMGCAGQVPEIPVKADYNTITFEEIQAALEKRPLQNAFELIEYLRPKYFMPRMQTTVNQGVMQREPIVYLNNVRFGKISELYNINILQIHEIVYLKSNEATQRFGIGHEGGAIIISTR
ncbi:MAG: hypothetical protein Q9P90_09700 [candidate division KSB1 bacterium]|nr:hypothetical protein [candidate division KSB1 bacterium]